MGRTLLGESQIVDNVSTTFKNGKSGVGLIIGQMTMQKDYAVYLARTPCEDEENKSDPIAMDKVDEKWIATHSRQVLRMLTGGLHILGVFAYGPPDVMKNAQVMLRKAVFAVHKVELKEQYHGNTTDNDSINDRYVLQICSLTKKLTCRTFDVSDPKCGGKPADFKSQSFSDKWSKLEMSMKIDTSFTVDKNASSDNLEKQMQKGFVPVMENILNSLALINGTLRDPGESLVAASSASGGGGGGKKKKGQQATVQQENFTVKLLCSPTHPTENMDTQKIDSIATMTLKGTIYGVAFVHNKASVKEAAQAIKQDFVRSLQARYELLCEDLLQSEESNDKRIIYEMPIRVFTPLPESSITLCDYLFPEEEIQYSVSRLHEFLDLSIHEDSVDRDRERFPTEDDIRAGSFPSPSSLPDGRKSFASKPSASAAKKATNYVVIGLSSTVAALAAAMSYMYLGEQ